MLRKLLKPFLLAASIFAMAGVYDLIWQVRPDCFRVQTGVNFLPLDLVVVARAYSAYSKSQPLPDMLGGPGEDAAVQRIKDIYEKFRLASISLESKNAELKKREARDTMEYKSFEQEQWSQYEGFVAEKTAPFAQQAAQLLSSMEAVLAASGGKSPDDLAAVSRNAYYALNMDRLKAELGKAKAEADAREYGLHHLTDFQRKPTQQEYIARSKDVERLRRSIFEEQKRDRQASRAVIQRVRRLPAGDRSAARLLGFCIFQCRSRDDSDVRRHLTQQDRHPDAGLPSSAWKRHSQRIDDQRTRDRLG